MAPLPITLSKGFISHCVSPVSPPCPQYIMHSPHSLDSVFSIDDFSILNKPVALRLRNTERVSNQGDAVRCSAMTVLVISEMDTRNFYQEKQ